MGVDPHSKLEHLACLWQGLTFREKGERLITIISVFQEVKYVRALYDHVSPEPSLLNFKKGDVIKIVHKEDLQEGWAFGIFNNQNGYFPEEYVTHIQEV